MLGCRARELQGSVHTRVTAAFSVGPHACHTHQLSLSSWSALWQSLWVATSADQDVGKEEPSSLLVGVETGTTTLGLGVEVPHKTETRTVTWPSYTTRVRTKGSLSRHTTAARAQPWLLLQRFQKSLNETSLDVHHLVMDKEDATHVHNTTVDSLARPWDNAIYWDKWIQPEVVISETSQTQRDKPWRFLSFVDGFGPQLTTKHHRDLH